MIPYTPPPTGTKYISAAALQQLLDFFRFGKFQILIHAPISLKANVPTTQTSIICCQGRFWIVDCGG